MVSRPLEQMEAETSQIELIRLQGDILPLENFNHPYSGMPNISHVLPSQRSHTLDLDQSEAAGLHQYQPSQCSSPRAEDERGFSLIVKLQIHDFVRNRQSKIVHIKKAQDIVCKEEQNQLLLQLALDQEGVLSLR